MSQRTRRLQQTARFGGIGFAHGIADKQPQRLVVQLILQ
jgi:hypothetical protein